MRAVAVALAATACSAPLRVGHTYPERTPTPRGLHFTLLSLDRGVATYRMTSDGWPLTVRPMAETGVCSVAEFKRAVIY